MLIQFITVVMVCVHLAMLSTYLGFCEAAHKTLKFRTTSSSASLEGLGCAIERNDVARGVKFNTETKVCESLTDAWFDDPTEESGHNYFKLFMMEEPIVPVQPYGHMISRVPRNIVVGFSVVFHFWRGSSMCCLYQEFRNEALDITPFHMNFQDLGIAALNDFTLTNGWGPEVRTTNPYQSSNRLYKVEFRMGMTTLDVMIDNDLYISFVHRAPITAYEKFSFLVISPGDDYCTKVQYYYPI